MNTDQMNALQQAIDNPMDADIDKLNEVLNELRSVCDRAQAAAWAARDARDMAVSASRKNERVPIFEERAQRQLNEYLSMAAQTTTPAE